MEKEKAKILADCLLKTDIIFEEAKEIIDSMDDENIKKKLLRGIGKSVSTIYTDLF